MHTLDIQSVIYQTESDDVTRTVRAASHAAEIARAAGRLGDWAFRHGDCSSEPMLSEAVRRELSEIVGAADGTYSYDFFDENLGHGGGHNRLFASGGYEQVLVHNPDGLLAPDALRVMLETVAGDIGMVEARQLPFEHRKEYDGATGDTPWGTGACAMIPRDLYAQLEGFDHETFYMYCDDVDFSWRLRLLGKRVVLQPRARFFHDKRIAVTGDWPGSFAELRYSAEAAPLLAYKFSRDDIVQNLLEIFEISDDEHLVYALDSFRRRERAGRLPERLDPEHRVATFIDGNYSEHRY